MFVIKYDFVLTEDIEMGSGCVLCFDGGSISGDGNNADTITGNNTEFINALVIEGITLAGTWKNNSIIATQLKTGSANKNANTAYLQTLITNFNEVIIPNGEWYIGTLEIVYSSACNILRGSSRKDTILYSEGISLAKSGVTEVPIGLSPKLCSLTLISPTNGSYTGINIGGYNALLQDLYIKGYEYGISKIQTSLELITSQIEKVVICKCAYGMDLTNRSSVGNFHSINDNIIKDCFIVDCTTFGIRLMGTSNIVRDCALQGSAKNIVLQGNSASTTTYLYSTAIQNCYFEAKVENNVVTGIDVDIQNVNSQQIKGLTIKNNYHSTVVAGQSRYYDVVKFALPPINYSGLLNNIDVDNYKKDKNGLYYPISLILGLNNISNISEIDGNKYLACSGLFGKVNLEIGRTYRAYMIARKTEGGLGTNMVMLIRNVITTSQMHYINYPASALDEDTVGYIDITPTTSTEYEIFQNASEPYLVRDLVFVDITLES